MEDERLRKRKLSNRESARRSRQRKQAALDILAAEIGRLKSENAWYNSEVNAMTQAFINVDGENSVLRAQLAELTQRLESLNSIASQAGQGFWNGNSPATGGNVSQNYQQVPIVASSAMFHY